MINATKHDRKSLSKSKRKDLICYICFMIWPVTQFLIFYVLVNFNSIRLAFQSISMEKSGGKYFFSYDHFTFDTFKRLFNKNELVSIVSRDMWQMIGTSLKAYLLLLCVGVPLGLFFSYYMYKRMPGSKTFRVLLFLPSILSAVVVGRIFLQFFDSALPAMLKDFAKIFPSKAENWLVGKIPKEGFYSADRMGMIMFFNVFVGFGTSVLMYSNKMIGIDPSISEAASLDGATGLKEFWHVTLPQVFSTLEVFLVTGVIGIFSNQFNLLTFLNNWGVDDPARMKTLGFYLYVYAKDAAAQPNMKEYTPPLAALGLLFTAVAIPLTFGVKALLEKFGPSEE